MSSESKSLLTEELLTKEEQSPEAVQEHKKEERKIPPAPFFSLFRYTTPP